MVDILIDKLSKRYGEKIVLQAFSLDLTDHRATCLMGPSGAGKTTLLRILAGLEKADSGTISGLSGARLAVVFQEDRLLEWLDAVENLRLVNRALTPAAIGEALRRFGLDGCAGQPVRELSGGMKRRVALLRALLSDGDVLLLDEPFNGLDDQTKAVVVRETLRLIDGRTTLLITHDPEEAEGMGARVAWMPTTTHRQED